MLRYGLWAATAHLTTNRNLSTIVRPVWASLCRSCYDLGVAKLAMDALANTEALCRRDEGIMHARSRIRDSKSPAVRSHRQQNRGKVDCLAWSLRARNDLNSTLSSGRQISNARKESREAIRPWLKQTRLLRDEVERVSGVQWVLFGRK